MEYQQFVLGDLMVNCYLLWSDGEAGVIDPGGPVDQIVALIEKHHLKLKWIVNTHGHVDHIIGNQELSRKFQAPLLIHQADRGMLTSTTANLSVFLGEPIISPDATRTLDEGDILPLGSQNLKIIATPGHTPGGISLYTEGLLFAGDTLFQESIGRTDFPGGSQQQLLASILEKLIKLPPETKVFPGHGAATTIAHEMKCNPFLNGDNEIPY